MRKSIQRFTIIKKMTLFAVPVICCLMLFFPGCSGTGGSGNSENDPIDQNDADNWNDSMVISVNSSRVSGVAPLSVFFDATGTTGLADHQFFSDGAAYMDATFAWDFDADDTDPDGKHEKASGFLAAHVYEQPGTYRVHLDVYDAAGETASEDITITVLEFSGTTYYVADDGSDANSGLTMEDPFLTAQHALTGDHMQSNTRVLFKKGDTFETPFFWVGPYDGPVIVDSYEDPEDPSDNKPLIYSTEVDRGWAAFSLDTDDWRVMNIAVRSGGFSFNTGPRYPGGISHASTSRNTLKYRTEEYYLGGLPMSPSGNYNTIAECEFHHVNGTGYTSRSAEDSHDNDGNAIIGNWVHDKTGDDEEHIFRLQGGSRYFIAYNTFGPNLLVHYDALTIRGNSEKVVIYKNKIEGWVQAFTPQNKNSAEEYQHHCIMDANLIMGQALYGNDRQAAIGVRAKDIVIRNNIIYNYQFGVGISDDTVVGSSRRIKIYNNTFINPAANDVFYIVFVDEACGNIDIKNNLMLDIAGGNPLYTIFLDIRGGDILNGESDNNLFYGSHWDASLNLFDGATLSDWQAATGNDQNSLMADPRLLSTDSNAADFCKPQAGSPAINAGAFTPNKLDYHGRLRDHSRDIGACEY
ncbi:MAG: PKD domain-containing protein [Desulfatitalea sp.]|nr:PKD domain-containing protein [Desulfatitalea sp.]